MVYLFRLMLLKTVWQILTTSHRTLQGQTSVQWLIIRMDLEENCRSSNWKQSFFPPKKKKESSQEQFQRRRRGKWRDCYLTLMFSSFFFSLLSVKPSYELSFGQSQSTQDGVSVAWQLIEPDRKSPSQKLQLSHIKGSIEPNRIQPMAMTEQSQETSPTLQAEVGMHAQGAETPLQYCYTHGPPSVYSRLI